ncbi:hypothetical protein [Lentzea sp. CA-135723]|uniref:hypothetical protein n=1 Tax=Lentzea sp. CA-135723 TaxID=3239950 RepID=UPI003D8CFE16
MSRNSSSEHDDLRAELHRERERVRALEVVNRLQAAGLSSLSELAGDLRCQVADLHDDAIGSQPMRNRGLRNVTGRMSGLAETLSRAADGYAGVRTTDMIYLDVDDDLRAHRWTPRPDRVLEDVFPPVPIGELSDRRGYVRGWHRGPHWITLWFTSPHSFAYADSSDFGRLSDSDAVRCVITSGPPMSADELAEWVAAQRESHAVPFDASYLRVTAHLHASWGGPIDDGRCDEHGHSAPNGPGRRSVWACPSDPDLRLYIWSVGDEPAHVTYWAGPVVDMAHLVQITGHCR